MTRPEMSFTAGMTVVILIAQEFAAIEPGV
jgi:hypothetical protein